MNNILTRMLCICISLICFHSVEAGAYSAYGSRGNEVVAIQKRLSALGLYNMECDGIFGTATEKAVIKYQNSKGLVADGIAGIKTLSSLKVISKNDLELLACVINGEARGESFEGQVAVGAVVLNRIKHPAFPDTLKEVVYQKGAFTAVNDGQIQLKVNDSCKKAALAALIGEDPTGGAIYYYNPSTATCKWIRTRNIIKIIGNHVFCV